MALASGCDIGAMSPQANDERSGNRRLGKRHLITYLPPCTSCGVRSLAIRPAKARRLPISLCCGGRRESIR